MSNHRRSASALIEMHRRNPSLCTIFVEGVSDQAIIRHIFRGHVPDEVAIWAVDQIEVDVQRAEDVGGNRQLVVDLAKAAQKREVSSIIGLVDRNFDFATEIGTSLVKTSCSDIEFELVNYEEIKALIEVVCGRPASTNVIQAAVLIAQKIFVCRRFAFNNGLSKYLSVPDFQIFVSHSHNDISFVLDKFLAAMDARNRSGHVWRKSSADIAELLNDARFGTLAGC